jgi:hypothetical protein
MTLLHEIEWEAPLIEPYRDPDAEVLMRKKYGFVMDSVAFYSRSPWIVRSQVRFDIQRDVLVHVDVDLAEIIGLVVSQTTPAASATRRGARCYVFRDTANPASSSDVSEAPGGGRDRWHWY